MDKRLEEIKYDRDDDKETLIDVYDKIENLIPKLEQGSEDREKASQMLEELDYFIDLQERDEDLEERGL